MMFVDVVADMVWFYLVLPMMFEDIVVDIWLWPPGYSSVVERLSVVVATNKTQV